MNYLEFEAEDFASDETFHNWYYKRNLQDEQFFDQWLHQNPHMKPKVDEAMILLNNFTGTEEVIGAQQIQSSWQHLASMIDENDVVKPKNHSLVRRRFLLSAAAVTIIFISVTWYFLANSGHEILHQTDFGETKSITLPDNSVVTLNSNSQIKFHSNFGQGQKHRKVELKGEAYFSVIHTAENTRFLVETPKGVTVEVFGTEFNVKERRGKTKVVLNSGKISLNIKDGDKNIVMTPGELVDITEDHSSYRKTTVNTDLYTSWKCKVFVFEDTPLKEVVSLLEDNYGLHVEVTDTTLLEQNVSGSVPSDNISLLMEGLSASFGLSIHHSHKNVIIRRK